MLKVNISYQNIEIKLIPTHLIKQRYFKMHVVNIDYLSNTKQK
jgi:hypothetical protein